MTDISIIMTIYNTEKFLRKSINSILNQTYKDFELILVNDGSTDNSLYICKEYQKRDKRINIINQTNLGAVLARRRGLDIAKGKYVIFIDSDDWVDIKFVEKLYFEIMKTDSDICICKRYKTLNRFTLIKKDVNNNFNNFYDKQTEYTKSEIKGKIVKSFFKSGCFPCAVTSRIYKRKLFDNTGKYTKDIKFFGEDLYLNFELFLKAEKVTLLDETLYYYRQGGGTSKYMKYYFDDIVNGLRIKKKIILENYSDEEEDILQPMYMNFLELYKSCIFNLFYSNFKEETLKEIIKCQLDNSIVIQIANAMENKNFDVEFVKAINKKDINYLYNISKKNKRSRNKKDKFMSFL